MPPPLIGTLAATAASASPDQARTVPQPTAGQPQVIGSPVALAIPLLGEPQFVPPTPYTAVLPAITPPGPQAPAPASVRLQSITEARNPRSRLIQPAFSTEGAIPAQFTQILTLEIDSVANGTSGFVSSDVIPEPFTVKDIYIGVLNGSANSQVRFGTSMSPVANAADANGAVNFCLNLGTFTAGADQGFVSMLIAVIQFYGLYRYVPQPNQRLWAQYFNQSGVAGGVAFHFILVMDSTLPGTYVYGDETTPEIGSIQPFIQPQGPVD